MVSIILPHYSHTKFFPERLQSKKGVVAVAKTLKFYFKKQIQSYFRKERDSLSSLAYKNINYYSLYLKEHIKFARIFYNNRVSKNTYLKYIDIFFRRVRHRLTKKQKLSFIYLKIFTYYKLKRFVV